MKKSACLFYVLIPVLAIGTWAVNYHMSYASLWILFLMPAILSVVLIPKWKAVLVAGSVMMIVMAVTETLVYIRGSIYVLSVPHLFVAGLVGWILFLFMAYLVIKNERLIKELEKLALTDPLTKAYNRRYLEMHMEKALPIAEKEKKPLAIVTFDIDHFKKVNDTFGHEAGDMVLRKLSKTLKKKIRSSDIFVRLGGEEFLVVYPSTSEKQAYTLAEKMRRSVEKESFRYKDKRIPITISMGVAQFQQKQNLQEFIHIADEALYRAKESGRNQVVMSEKAL